MSLRSEDGMRRFVEGNSGNLAFLRYKREGLTQGKYSDWDIAVRDRDAALDGCEAFLGKAWLRIPRQYRPAESERKGK